MDRLSRVDVILQPTVLIMSYESSKSCEIASKIGAKYSRKEQEIVYFLWNIDNKYYTAEISLCASQEIPRNISEMNVEALILHLDPDDDYALQKLVSWKTTIIPLAPNIQVFFLLCDTFPNSSMREKVGHWCSKEMFEMIEMEESDFQDHERDESVRNTSGIDRIIEALHAHTWSNIKLKDRITAEILQQEEINEVMGRIEDFQLKDSSSGKGNIEWLESGISREELSSDDDARDFAQLIGQLMQMKNHAASLPSNQKKIVAEQLVKTFWEAIGGDPSEISDSD